LRAHATEQAQQVVALVDHFLPWLAQAINQATRRVLQGEGGAHQGDASSSLGAAPQVIQRHTSANAVAFGRTLLVEDVAAGSLRRCDLRADGGLDHPQLPASLAAQHQQVGHPPDLLARDRGFFPPEHEAHARAAGSTQIVLPKIGRVSQERQRYERPPWCCRSFRFRAGSEARIRVLRRCSGQDRCRDHGLERWVDWGILTHTLATIAHTKVAHLPPPRPMAA